MHQKVKIAFVLLMLCGFLITGCYCAYRLYISYEAYAESDRTYEAIRQQVIKEETQQGGLADELYIPQHTVDFDALRAINEDTAAWIYCPDTVIDYPVLAAEDNSYYLNRLADKSYGMNGSLFLDCSCAEDFSDSLSIIYGHNLKSGKMFGTLTQYKKQSYYDEHPYWYLYTETQNYRIALLYGAVVSAKRWNEENYAGDISGMLAYARENSTFESIEGYDPNQRLIVLITCSYEYQDARYVLVANLQPA
jgi:sortase B